MITHIVQLEDDSHLAKIMRLALHSVRPDLKLTQFNSGDALLEFVESTNETIDAFILDICVPGSQAGLQVAEWLRQRHSQSTILLTSSANSPPRQLLRSLHADYVQKPWHVSALVKHLLNIGDAEMSLAVRRARQQSSRPATQHPLGAKAAGQVERSLMHLTDLIRNTLQVAGAAVFVFGEGGALQTQEVVQPEAWASALPEATLQRLLSDLIALDSPLLIEDVRLYVEEAATHQSSPLVAFGGLKVTVPDDYQIGLICVFDKQARQWTTQDVAFLEGVGRLLSDTLKLQDTIHSLLERNDELNGFSNVIAHDLKSPLSAIIGYAESIRVVLGDDTHSKAQTFVTKVLSAADRISNMITHLLWLARLDRPMETIYAIQVESSIDAALRRLSFAIESRGVRVTVPPDLPPVLAHEVWVEEIFANLIGNAIKYMGDDNRQPTVWIRAEREGRHIRYEVHDNGIGIAPEYHAALFNSFSRVTKHTKVEGSGLGLAIVQRIVNRLGGKVGIQSEVGHGSAFWFTLLAAQPDA
jgi:signal transduction histidine kinase